MTVLVPRFAQAVVDGVSGLCKKELEAAHLLPRIYRRTNRDVRVK